MLTTPQKEDRAQGQSKKRGDFFFQPKLSVNQPNDIYEQEANNVADKVMRMSKPSQEPHFFSPINIQRKCEHCEDEEKLHRKEINTPQENTFLRAELNQQNETANTVDDTVALDNTNAGGCSYTVKYGNLRLMPVPTCGGQVQFDILQVQSENKNCQKQLKGKQLSEVVTTDNNCFKAPVITGPPVLLGDNGIPVSTATDTYGANIPKVGLIDCSYGIPCPQEMKQILSIDGKPVTTNIIRFDICGDNHGCITKIFMNNAYLGRIGTGAYQNFSSEP